MLKRIRLLIAFLFLSSSIFAGYFTDLPPPYCSVEILPYNVNGWVELPLPLERLLKKQFVRTVVEVGCGYGGSTCKIASLLTENGIVYAIVLRDEKSHQERFGDSIYPYQFQQFLSNVIHRKLTNKIIPICMNSRDAIRHLPAQPDIIFINTAHFHGNLLNELDIWFSCVRGRGILCGDGCTDPVIIDRVFHFAKDNNLTVYSHLNFWQLIE